MNREQILKMLRTLKPEVETRYKVKSLSLFGSVVRNEHGPSSDIDVLVDFEEEATLFDLSGLGLFLEEKLRCKVDVVPRRALREEIRETVLREAVTV